MQLHEVDDDLIIEQAVRYAQQFGWVVLPAQCYVQTAPSGERMQSSWPTAWHVYMSAQPFYNTNLQKPMPLGCRMELIDGCLCTVNLYEPSDRQQYLKQKGSN